MSEKILTISVAAYNIEKTICKCIDSVLDSDCKDDIEILIIDDGSSDGTADIAGEYEKKYPDTIRLICKENGGHGSTINTGIKEAKGSYFRPLDGDDWLKTDNIDNFVSRLKKESSDIILCNYESHYGEGCVKVTDYTGLKDNEKYCFDEIVKYVDWMNYHSLTYKTDILKKNNINIDEHCFYVDTELISFPIPFVDNISYYDMELYCYRRDDESQSVSSSSRMKHISDSKKVAIRLLRFLRKNERSLTTSKRKYLIGIIAGHCLWHFKGLMLFSPDKERYRDLLLFERYIKRMSPEVFEIMPVESSNRMHPDVDIVKYLRRFNYKPYFVYGAFSKMKQGAKHLIGRVSKTQKV